MSFRVISQKLTGYPSVRKACITGFLKGEYSLSQEEADELELNYDSFRLVFFAGIGEKYQYNYAEILRATELKDKNYELITVDDKNLLLFKGQHIIKRFESFLSRYKLPLPPEKDSPLDTCFFVCGRIIDSYEKLPECYMHLVNIYKKAFFTDGSIHVLREENIDISNASGTMHYDKLLKLLLGEYSMFFINQIQVFNRNKIHEKLFELQELFTTADCSISEIKTALSKLYVDIFSRLMLKYSTQAPPLCIDTAGLEKIRKSFLLSEIIDYLSSCFDAVMTAIGHSSRESIIEDIIYYIEHNYNQNLTIESIAPIFGYNSSYLGKIFHKKTGMRLNNYLDTVRINHAKEILAGTKFQVYRVAEMVGYRNVDYFHIKFRKHTGQSPLEYRQKNGQE